MNFVITLHISRLACNYLGFSSLQIYINLYNYSLQMPNRITRSLYFIFIKNIYISTETTMDEKNENVKGKVGNQFQIMLKMI